MRVCACAQHGVIYLSNLSWAKSYYYWVSCGLRNPDPYGSKLVDPPSQLNPLSTILSALACEQRGFKIYHIKFRNDFSCRFGGLKGWGPHTLLIWNVAMPMWGSPLVREEDHGWDNTAFGWGKVPTPIRTQDRQDTHLLPRGSSYIFLWTKFCILMLDFLQQHE